MQDVLRLAENVGGADPPAAEAARKDALAGLARDGEDDAPPTERAVRPMLEHALERVALPRPELVAEIAADPSGRLGAVGAGDVRRPGSFQPRRDEFDRFRRFPGISWGDNG